MIWVRWNKGMTRAIALFLLAFAVGWAGLQDIAVILLYAGAGLGFGALLWMLIERLIDPLGLNRPLTKKDMKRLSEETARWREGMVRPAGGWKAGMLFPTKDGGMGMVHLTEEEARILEEARYGH